MNRPYDSVLYMPESANPIRQMEVADEFVRNGKRVYIHEHAVSEQCNDRCREHGG